MADEGSTDAGSAAKDNEQNISIESQKPSDNAQPAELESPKELVGADGSNGTATMQVNGHSNDETKEPSAIPENDPPKLERPEKTSKPDTSDELRHDDWRDRRKREGRNRSRSPRNNRGRDRPQRAYDRRYMTPKNRQAKNMSKHIERAESGDHDAIRNQVEFYFGDSNLPGDKFLLEMVNGAENKPVPIKVLHGFSRMKHFQPYSTVVAALRDSKRLNVFPELLTVGDVTEKIEASDEPSNAPTAQDKFKVTGEESVARKAPLSDVFKVDDIPGNRQKMEEEMNGRVVYVKGFTEEEQSTQDDIEAFFEPFGPINSIRLRRHEDDGTFKRSIFIEFGNREIATQFLDLSNKPTWRGQNLEIMTKEEYEKKKGPIREKNRQRRGEHHGRGNGRARGRGGGGRGRGNHSYERGTDRDVARAGSKREHHDDDEDDAVEDSKSNKKAKSEETAVVEDVSEQMGGVAKTTDEGAQAAKEES